MSKRYDEVIVINRDMKFYHLNGILQFWVEKGCKYDALDIEYKGHVEPEEADAFFNSAVRELNATKRRCLTAGV